MSEKTDMEKIDADSRRARLDTQTLEQRAKHLPEPMQEAFVWFGSYCREECGRDIDILHAKITELGYKHDKTTWSKIIRGMWNQSAHGTPCPPCLAVDKFLKIVQALRSDARIRELGGRIPFVKTPTAEDIFNFIDIRRAPDRVNKFGIIIGETGSQKTASTGEYARQNNHGMVVRIEAPETPSMTQFMTDFAACYGFNAQDGYLRKKNYVLNTFNHKRTLIVENIQRLYDPRCGDKQPIFSFLQKLQEDTNGTIILTLTPTFEKTLLAGLNKGFFEQFEGRAGGRRNFLRLPEHPPLEDVLMIAKAFGLQQADKHGEELVKIAREPGRIRRLFEDLQDAKIAAEADKEKLTIQYIREVRDEN